MAKRSYIFLGASIRGRNHEEAQGIAARVKKVCAILDQLGYDYDADMLVNVKIHKKDFVDFKVPLKYAEMSDALINSISALRPDSDPEKIRRDVACNRWAVSLIEKASACIWDVTRSSTGTGFEIATALALEKHCLVLYDRETVSSMISGCTSRLLTVKQWADQRYEEIIKQFLSKAEGGLDRVLRFNMSQEMAGWIDEAAKRYEFKNASEYLRFLVDQDRQRNKSSNVH